MRSGISYHYYCYLTSVVLAVCLFCKINILPDRRYIIRSKMGDITTYGLLSGISIFSVLLHLSNCKIDALKIFASLFLYFLSTYYFCDKCKNEYHAITIYQYFVPFLPIFFNCGEIPHIICAINIGLAIGRLGCRSAGCCYGNICHKNDPIAIEYSDPEQIINKQNGTNNCWARGTVIMEAGFQFLIAGLCFQYPKYSGIIFSFLNFVLIKFTKKYRSKGNKSSNNQNERNNYNHAYIGLFLTFCYHIFCLIANNRDLIICNITSKNVINYAIISVIIMFIFSNDINFDKIISYSRKENKSKNM